MRPVAATSSDSTARVKRRGGGAAGGKVGGMAVGGVVGGIPGGTGYRARRGGCCGDGGPGLTHTSTPTVAPTFAPAPTLTCTLALTLAPPLAGGQLGERWWRSAEGGSASPREVAGTPMACCLRMLLAWLGYGVGLGLGLG